MNIEVENIILKKMCYDLKKKNSSLTQSKDHAYEKLGELYDENEMLKRDIELSDERETILEMEIQDLKKQIATLKEKNQLLLASVGGEKKRRAI